MRGFDKVELPVRLIVVIVSFLLPCGVAAQVVDLTASGLRPVQDSSEFQLGGATMRLALVPDVIEQEIAPRPALTLPQSNIQSQRETTLGPATIFLGEGLDGGRDAVEMGTFLSSGAARAGFSVTYLEHEEEVSRSEVFLDYSVTDRFSVGLSGILNAQIEENETVPQLGLSAEYATEGGAFLQGGVANASHYDPVIGMSIGLRF